MIEPASPSAREHLLHLNHIGGHHRSFIDLFHHWFGLDASIGGVGAANFKRLVRAEQLMFATLDDDVRGFVLVALARTMCGRRTAGIFMRPQSCFFRGARGWIKRQLFRSLRRVPLVSTLSLLPFEAMPHLSGVATHAVHDPQLWDVVDNDDAIDEALVSRVVAEAHGRPVLTFLGTVNAGKGFGHLAAIIAADPTLTEKLCVVIAGHVQKDSAGDADAAAKAGAIVWDRRISDSELAALYRASSAVWACYHPDYDQASGIFGRAVQRGRRPVIRDGAVIVGSYVDRLGIDAVRLSEDPRQAAATLIAELTGQEIVRTTDPAVLREWRREFIRAVDSGIGASHRAYDKL